MKTPYPGRFESHESWMRRCDEAERQQKADNDNRWAGSPDSRGLTDKQAAKLAKVQAKLPEGWHYWVTNDNQQIGLRSPESNGDLALATKEGKYISAQVYQEGVEGAKMAILINRASAAVWGKQASWFHWDHTTNNAVPIFPHEDWNKALKELRK